MCFRYRGNEYTIFSSFALNSYMRYTRSRFPFTSNDINFQSRGEIPISQNLISFFFRSSRHRGAREMNHHGMDEWNLFQQFYTYFLFPFLLLSFIFLFFSVFFSFFFSLFSFLPIAMQKKLIIDNCFIGST